VVSGMVNDDRHSLLILVNYTDQAYEIFLPANIAGSDNVILSYTRVAEHEERVNKM